MLPAWLLLLLRLQIIPLALTSATLSVGSSLDGGGAMVVETRPGGGGTVAMAASVVVGWSRLLEEQKNWNAGLP